MRPLYRNLLFTFSLLLSIHSFVQPSLARNKTFSWLLQGGWRVSYHKNDIQPEAPPITYQNKVGWSFFLGAFGQLNLAKNLQLTAQVDSGEWLLGGVYRPSNTRFLVQHNDLQRNTPSPLETHHKLPWPLAENFFLKELYLSAQWNTNHKDKLTLDIGMMHQNLARGLLFQDFALGASFAYQSNKNHSYDHWRLRFDAFLPDASFTPTGKRSPTLHLAARGKLSEFRFGASATYMFDGDNIAASRLFPVWQRRFAPLSQAHIPAICQRFQSDCAALPTSSGHHLWFGAHIDIRFMLFQFITQVLIHHANHTLTIDDQANPLAHTTALLHFKLNIYFLRSFTLTLFGLVYPGGDRKTQPDFMGISPQRRLDGLLFNGGVNIHLTRRSPELIDSYPQHALFGWDLRVDVRRTSFGISFHNILTLSQNAPAPGDPEQSSLIPQFGAFFQHPLSPSIRFVLQANLLLETPTPTNAGAYEPIIQLMAGFDFAYRPWN